jgi:hypothetical protein
MVADHLWQLRLLKNVSFTVHCVMCQLLEAALTTEINRIDSEFTVREELAMSP